MMKTALWQSALTRVYQVLSALTARRAPSDPNLTRALSPDEQTLFAALSPVDRAHALRVAERLEQAGYHDPALLKAGLLHDIGKAGADIGLLHRILHVALGVLAPGLLAWLGADPGGWHLPFYALAHHAEIGAELVRQAGGDALTVALVRYHDAADIPPPLTSRAELWRALRAADDAG